MKCAACKSDKILKEETEQKDVFSYLCLNCGFTSNDNDTKERNKDNDFSKHKSKLISDLSFFESEDGNAKRWYPSVFVHENGMVFPEGDSSFNWNWVYVPIIKLTEEEMNSSEYSGFKTRLAYEQKKIYDKFEFLDAIKNLGEIIEDLGI